MMLMKGLSRQILFAMSSMAVAAGLLVFFGTYFAFSILFYFSPWSEGTDNWLTGLDFIILSILIFIALIGAAVASIRLARRILEPLESLAQSARRIKDGDLSARAVPGDHSLGETALLVEDFNAMARRLQDMAADMTLWNATIAHELRTPLTILKGRLQGMIDGVFEPDEKSLHALVLQVDSLARLVEDLRTVTLADSGHLDLRIQPVRLKDEIQRLAGVLEQELKEDGFELRLQLSDVLVSVDAMRIRQVLLALVTNARRYAIRGIIEISLSVENEMTILRVADEGPGLDSDIASSAFEPFRRGTQSGSLEKGGNGLGLSVVRAIVEAHGGKIRYAPSDKGGAMFKISLGRPVS
ncbi:MAG: HAMP domain-containing protein [Alphaproteobacteria bacterium]|nr:HAMP domain-containing protein [Alphaproteobacteria bacterium]MBU1552459.1 HAMP domain-containing protein [Alphaproteobacteria bacterium]MBU2339510.1 HAMP domain-containing protein [Alphaproteobacteria bacterium]MBU2390222.1 HAMP domain-containing protein [Alphaproteobacteria bacterium]